MSWSRELVTIFDVAFVCFNTPNLTIDIYLMLNTKQSRQSLKASTKIYGVSIAVFDHL